MHACPLRGRRPENFKGDRGHSVKQDRRKFPRNFFLFPRKKRKGKGQMPQLMRERKEREAETKTPILLSHKSIP